MTRRFKEGRARARPSVRAVVAWATATFSLLTILVVAVLLWASTALGHTTSRSIRDAQSRAVASALAVALLSYQRTSNLILATGEPELADRRDREVAEVRRLLAEAQELVSAPDEEELVDSITGLVDVYLRGRASLEESGAGLEEVVVLTRPTLRAASDRLGELQDLNDAQVRQAQAESVRVRRLATGAGITAIVLVFAGWVGVALGLRRFLVQPMLELHEAVIRFRSGDTDARVEESGSREAADLARAFNGMADGIARQRENQLAFVAGVAHELRNPLAALSTDVQALGLAPPGEGRDGAFARVSRQVDRLTRMLDDLLDAARIEAGYLELQPEELDLRREVQEVVRLYAPTAPDHDLVVEAPDEPVTVRGDPLRIDQVITNLVSNAIKFSPEGGPVEVAVALRGDEAVLTVADTGVGIAPEELSEIFTSFRRSRPDVAPGAGLGLSVVRRIVAAHGGTIEVESEPGVGSTFRVRLPAGRLAGRP